MTALLVGEKTAVPTIGWGRHRFLAAGTPPVGATLSRIGAIDRGSDTALTVRLLEASQEHHRHESEESERAQRMRRMSPVRRWFATSQPAPHLSKDRAEPERDS